MASLCLLLGTTLAGGRPVPAAKTGGGDRGRRQGPRSTRGWLGRQSGVEGDRVHAGPRWRPALVALRRGMGRLLPPEPQGRQGISRPTEHLPPRAREPLHPGGVCLRCHQRTIPDAGSRTRGRQGQGPGRPGRPDRGRTGRAEAGPRSLQEAVRPGDRASSPDPPADPRRPASDRPDRGDAGPDHGRGGTASEFRDAGWAARADRGRGARPGAAARGPRVPSRGPLPESCPALIAGGRGPGGGRRAANDAEDQSGVFPGTGGGRQVGVDPRRAPEEPPPARRPVGNGRRGTGTGAGPPGERSSTPRQC